MPFRRQLHLICDTTTLLADDGRDRVRAAIEAGVDAVQIRDHAADARTMLAAAKRILPCASSQRVVVIINDRADVALALLPTRRATPGGALVPVGVHLGERSLPVDLVRRHLPLPLVGRSVHTVEDALQAAADGADYVTFGHIFPSASHPVEPPVGLDRLRDVVTRIEAPVLAIGGIDATNAADVLATGAAGIAVISAILRADDPGRATAELRAILDAATSSRN